MGTFGVRVLTFKVLILDFKDDSISSNLSRRISSSSRGVKIGPLGQNSLAHQPAARKIPNRNIAKAMSEE